MAADHSPIPPALYIHFPWCVRKCPYCDFNSHALRGEVPEDAYVDALLRDLDFELHSEPRFRVRQAGDDIESSPEAAKRPGSRPLASIFMGGGTPSLFSDRAIGRLLEAVNRRLPFAGDIEITLEANPGTAEAANFRGYRAAGVNRLSIGVQSLEDAQLKRLGRIHDSAEALRAYALARAAGFDNINLDMMYALPQQTPDAAVADLRALIALAPEHLSWYQLTLEPNTEFGLHPPAVPDEDAAWTIQEQGQALLAAAGYAQYEVSAYARGPQSRHNRNYWEFGDYLGIGAGAHGKRSQAPPASRGPPQVVRRARHKHPRTYMERAGDAAALQEERRIAAEELPFEFLMNALRLRDGFCTAAFAARTGLEWDERIRGLSEARRRALLEESGRQVRASELGWRHLNGLLRLFLET